MATGPKKEKLSRGTLVGLGLMGGVSLGVFYGIYDTYFGQSSAKENKPIPAIGNEQAKAEDFMLSEPPPEFKLARRIVNPADTTGLKITLFQYQTCPFCCKARAFLDYHGFNYDVVEVNSVMRQQVKWSKYKKVPTVVVETPKGEIFQLNDSTLIVSAMYSLLIDRQQGLSGILPSYPPLRYTEGGKEKMDVMNKYFLMYRDEKAGRSKEDIVRERKWRKWVDDELVHKLSPNVYRTPREALQAFRWFDETGEWREHFKSWERYLVIYVGAAVMWIIGKRLKKRHNLKDDVRESFYDDLALWTRTLKKQKTTFMGGSKPDLSDLAVYGVLNAIEGCDAWKEAQEATLIGEWFAAMQEAVGKRQGQEMLAAK